MSYIRGKPSPCFQAAQVKSVMHRPTSSSTRVSEDPASKTSLDKKPCQQHFQ
ncbi:hypothetical protein A2U01_0076885, partial [Trifolium medium]|nr:hypothetical protein [Trifolium medium]